MSDLMTNIDDSDVLASVRRLVSKSSAPKRDSNADELKRFLLTPNFRVSTPEPVLQKAPAVVRSIRSPEQDDADVVLKLAAAELVQAEQPQVLKAYRLVPAERVFDAKILEASADSELSLEQRIAELEASVGGYEAEWEPDGAETLHRETPEVMPRGFAEPSPRLSFGAKSTASGVPEDQNALRSMISEIIREELQGDLGEKMTRNMRRLVRREVQSAMTLKDFE